MCHGISEETTLKLTTMHDLRQQLTAAIQRAEAAEQKVRDQQYELRHLQTCNLKRQRDELSRAVGQIPHRIRLLRQRAEAAEAECKRLREALERNRQGMMNLLEFRKIPDSDRYGNLTRHEIEEVIAHIDAALSPAAEPKEQADGD